jgi:TRAP-type C4-dicarboxylate transport system substrate-binding protein
MKEKLGAPRAFRQWQANQELLDKLEEKGVNVSELINETLAENIKAQLVKFIARKKAELDKAVNPFLQ